MRCLTIKVIQMKFLKELILPVIIGCCMTACSPAYYLPTKQNVQVFDKKGDIVVGGNLGLYGTIGAEAGYAFTDHMGVYSSFKGLNISTYGGSEEKVIRDYIWDNELILYTKLKYDFYAACNFGAGFGEFDVNNPYYELKLNRQFVQPSIGITFFDVIQTSLSTRFTRLDYSLKSYTINETAYDDQMLREYFMFGDLDKHDIYFLEPAITFGLDFGGVKTQFQYSRALNIGGGNVRNWDQNLFLSINFNISAFLPRKKIQ